MILDSPIISGSSTVTGDLTVLGTLTASVSGSVTSASYATNAETLDGLDSTSFTTTSSFNAASSSFSTRTTNLETASGSFSTRVTSTEGSVSSLNNKSGSYATTGSNNFNGNQVVTGSLTTTGQIIAQTLNVQQVTSSIVYSSGSNIFGNSVSNTQQFTGSLQVSGSNHYMLGKLGINTTSPSVDLTVVGNIKAGYDPAVGLVLGLIPSGVGVPNNNVNAFILWGDNATFGGNNGDLLYIPRTSTTGEHRFYTANTGLASEKMRITYDGNVGIGTTSPNSKLHTVGNITIENSTNAPYIQFVESGDNTDAKARIEMDQISGTDGQLLFYTEGSGTLTNRMGITNTGAYEYRASDGVISMTAIDTSGGTANDYGSFVFNLKRLADGDTWPNTLVLKLGNVGIGTSSPTRLLELYGPALTSDTPTLRISSADSTGTRKFGIEFYSRTGADVRGKLLVDNNGRVYLDDNGGGGVVLQANGGSGNVGIGISSLGSWAKLQISGNAAITGTGYYWSDNLVGGSTPAYLEYNYGTSQMTIGSYGASANGYIIFTSGGSSERMRITAGGNVAIGNTSPLTKLVVNNAITGAILPYIQGTGLSYNNEGISVAGSNTNNTNIGNGLTLYNNVASVGAYGPVVAWSSMTVGGAYNATYAFITGEYRGAGGDNNWSRGDLIFGTGDTYGATERMRIKDSGNVGIGTTSPSAKLHVNGTLKVSDTFSWASGDGVNWYIQGQANGPTIRMKYDGGSTNRSGALGWVDNGGGRYEALTWQDTTVWFSGNVGIGITSPGASLHVAGNEYIAKSGGGGTYKQTVVGQTTAAASGSAKKIAYVGFTHSVRVYIWANQSTAHGSSAIADIVTLYGSSNGGTVMESNFGNVTDISITYNNGGSPAYTIDVTLVYSGTAPTINYVIEGINHDNNIYTI